MDSYDYQLISDVRFSEAEISSSCAMGQALCQQSYAAKHNMSVSLLHESVILEFLLHCYK